MNGSGNGRRDRRRSEGEGSADARIQAAVERIERAARNLSASATDRAADYIEGVADRMSSPNESRRERRRDRSWPWSGRPRSARLCRDRENGVLLGVCAGIANYYGLETWVVRVIAVTGLIFLFSVTLVGYFVAALIMDPSPKRQRRIPARRRSGRGRRDRWEEEGPDEYSWVPRQRLRDVRADYDQMELKLRRMETHVTSESYQLHRELADLERRDAPSASRRSG